MNQGPESSEPKEGELRASAGGERCGWSSDLARFSGTEPRIVRLRLQDFVRDAGVEQVRAWDRSIPLLQRECRELVDSDRSASGYSAILEYELPLESRRIDVVVLENGVVVVVELKGKLRPDLEDLDQVMAYARDLRAYHTDCHDRPVHAVLVPTRAGRPWSRVENVFVVGPEGLGGLLGELARDSGARPLSPEEFLRADSYQPMPSLVEAARRLFAGNALPYIKRARAATDPAVRRVIEIAREAAATQTRRLVLITGVPGSGKTLVGLRLVHDPEFDSLSAKREGASPCPAVFLSGNGPLVEVLQYALREAGGGGKTFVRGVRDYVRTYSRSRASVPSHHVMVFDEAQRAFDRNKMAETHKGETAAEGKSEPEWFIEFAERVPEWCVVVGLIGCGQEIHVGEEAGIVQWKEAIEQSRSPESWTIHAPAGLEEQFAGLTTSWEPMLNLDIEIRYHVTTKVHQLVEAILQDGAAKALLRDFADEIHAAGHRLLVTRDLERARAYARGRYEGAPLARYGVLASSKDRDLVKFAVDNSFQTTKRLQVGPWYNADPSDPESCCQLDRVATEFSAQGLELDLAVLAWGTDFIRKENVWTNVHARGYRRGARVVNPLMLRRNAYRVLLTRGRDGTVVFVPPDERLSETAEHLLCCGFRDLRQVE